MGPAAGGQVESWNVKACPRLRAPCMGLPVAPADLPVPCSTQAAGRQAKGKRMKEAPQGQKDISFCRTPDREPTVLGPYVTPGGSNSPTGRLSLRGRCSG